MSSAQLLEGTLLNERYRILRALGQGGMGTVYLATHERLDAVVAVKEVRGKPSDEQEFEELMHQCEQEARFLVKLNHPNLPKVTDAFIENDRVYVVMEYIQGVTLEQRLRDAGTEGLDPALVIDWGLQIADVIAYLHSQDPPIVFRDLKPANIMVQEDGNIRLIDFGIARRFQPGADKDTSLLGSVGYSPPEQFGRNQTDPRSDIYAFGATLHHLITGMDPSDHPFKFTPLIALKPNLPAALSDLLSQCLNLEPADRPTTIHEAAIRLLNARDELHAEGNTSHPSLSMSDNSLNTITSSSSTTDKRSTVSGKTDRTTKQPTQCNDSGRSELSPSGRMIISSTKSSSPYAPLFLVAIILTIIGLGAYALFPRSHDHDQPRIIPPAPSVTIPSIVVPKSSGDDPNSSLESSIPTDNTPVSTVDPAATIQITGQEIGQNGSDTPLLRLELVGSIKNRANTSGRAAVFFFDDQKNPVMARDLHGAFANKEGQLSVAHSVTVTSDEYSLHVILTIPASEFPSSSTTSLLKVQAAVFIDGKRVGESDFIDLRALPAEFYGDGTADQSKSNRRTGVGLGIGGGDTH